MARFLLLVSIVFCSCQKDVIEKLDTAKLDYGKVDYGKVDTATLNTAKLDTFSIKTEKDKLRFDAFKTHIKAFKTLNNAKVAFVLSVAENARLESSVSNIPVSLYVAMAIQETGWGTSKAYNEGFSLGNIKYYSENNLALAKLKNDYPDAKFSKINIHDDSAKDMFVLYENQEQALRHISYNLQGKYISYCKNHHNVYDWFKALQAKDPQKGKYAWATDKRYIKKLTKIVQKYRLYLLDI